MDDRNVPTFEELEALLNFSPEEGFRSMGDVREHLAASHETAILLMEKAQTMASCLEHAAQRLISVDGPMSKDVLNLMASHELMHVVTQMCLDCISHDALLMSTFLDLGSGSDSSLN